MKVVVAAVAAAIGLCVGAVAEEDWAAEEAKAFRTTLKEVDHDGTMLLYLNTEGVLSHLNRTLMAFDRISEISPFDDAEKLRQISILFRTLLVSLRMDDIQSAAFSSKTYQETLRGAVFQNRAYLHTGGESTGLFGNLMGWVNQPFTLWKKLPSNTLFALEGYWEPVTLWHSIMMQKNTLSTAFGGPVLVENRDLFSELEVSIREKLGVEPDKLFASMGGRYAAFALMSEETYEMQYLWSVPDRDGVLWGVLVKKLAGTWQQEGKQVLFQPTFMGRRRQLCYENGVVTFSSSELPAELLSEKHGDGGAAKVFAPYFDGMPESGTIFVYGNIGRGIFDSTLLFSGERTLEQISGELPPPMFSAVASVADDGYRLISRSNWGVPTLGTVLPALLTLRMMNDVYDELTGVARRNESCETNLAEIGEALAAYRAEEKRLPKAGVGGFEALVEKKFLKLSTLLCGNSAIPAQDGELTENSCSYIYLGGDGEKSGHLPLVIDKPGNHVGCFNVLFGDGHIESVRVDDGADLTTLILTLGAQKEYSQEEIMELMRKLADFGWIDAGTGRGESE